MFCSISSYLKFYKILDFYSYIHNCLVVGADFKCKSFFFLNIFNDFIHARNSIAIWITAAVYLKLFQFMHNIIVRRFNIDRIFASLTEWLWFLNWSHCVSYLQIILSDCGFFLFSMIHCLGWLAYEMRWMAMHHIRMQGIHRAFTTNKLCMAYF